MGTATALAVLATAVVADVLHLTGGRRVEGTIVHEDKSFVTLEMAVGRVRVDRAEIVKIERGKTPLEEWKDRFAEAKRKKDVGALRDLAHWCDERKLEKQRTDVLKAILEIDPNDAGANRELGRVDFEGRWVTPDEKRVIDEALETSRKLAAGLVLHEGKWIPAEERDAIVKGLEKVGDEWLTKEEARRRQGLVEYEGEWVRKTDLHVFMIQGLLQSKGSAKLNRVLGPHADVLVEQPPAYAESLSRVLEQVGVELEKLLGVADLFPVKLSEVTTSWTKPCVVLFQEAAPYKRCARLLAENGYLARYMLEGIESRGDGYAHHRPALVTTYQREEGDVLTANALHGFVMSAFSLQFPGYAPDWLIEGVAAYLQFRHTGTIGGKMSPAIKSFGEIEAPRLRLILRAGVAEKSLPRFADLFKESWETLGAVEYAQAVSLVQFLVETEPDATTRWMRLLSKATIGITPGAGDRWVEMHEKTLREAFGLSIAEIEAKWLAHAKKTDFAMTGIDVQRDD